MAIILNALQRTFFKVTQTRLEQRSHRPVNEACADSVHLRSSLRFFAFCLIKTITWSTRCHMRGSFFFISYFVHKAASLWSTLRLFSCFVFFQYPLFCVFCQNSNSFLFFVSPQGFLKRTRSWRRAKIFSTRRFGNFLSFRICFMHCVSIRQGVLRRLWLRWSPTRRCWRGR